MTATGAGQPNGGGSGAFSVSAQVSPAAGARKVAVGEGRPTRQHRVAGRVRYGPAGVERVSTPQAGGTQGTGYSSPVVLGQVDGVWTGGIGRSGESQAWYQRGVIDAYSRHFYRTNNIYQGVINKSTSYVVGRGFSLQARTADTAWNARAESLWREWSKMPDLKGRMNLHRMARMMMREYYLMGEALALKTSAGLVQIIEKEQVRDGNNVRGNGLTVDALGRVTAFKVQEYNRESGMLFGESRDLDARHVCWIMDPERPSTERGMPKLQSVFPLIHRLNDIQDSEALSWQMLSRIVMAVLSDGQFDPNAESGADTDSDPAEQLYETDYAVFWKGRVGEKLQNIEHNIPGMNFPDSMRMFLRLLGLPVGLPLEIILLDWSGGNYSQAKAVLEQYYQQCQTDQDLLEENFYRPLYLWKVGYWMQTGLLGPNDEWRKHEFLRPAWPFLDQEKEIRAQQMRVESGLATHAEVLSSTHRDRGELVRELVEEAISAAAAAKEVETATGRPCSSKRFMGLSEGKTEAAVNAGKAEGGAATEGAA